MFSLINRSVTTTRIQLDQQNKCHHGAIPTNVHVFTIEFESSTSMEPQMPYVKTVYLTQFAMIKPRSSPKLHSKAAIQQQNLPPAASPSVQQISSI